MLVGLGANKPWLGHPPQVTLARAAAALSALAAPGAAVVQSSFYRSPAWPDPAEPTYINAVARFESALPAPTLLAGLHAIEAAFGRMRSTDPKFRYAPRTLDLDLLAVGDAQRQGADLTLPHPRIAERDFVLLPLNDIAPAWQHPVSRQTASALLKALAEPITATPFPKESA